MIFWDGGGPCGLGGRDGVKIPLRVGEDECGMCGVAARGGPIIVLK